MNPYLAPLYSGIVSALLGYLIATVKKTRKEDKAIKTALGALLRSDMFDIYETYRDLDEVPESVQKEIDELWLAYHGLGFNHLGDKIHSDIMGKKTKV